MNYEDDDSIVSDEIVDKSHFIDMSRFSCDLFWYVKRKSFAYIAEGNLPDGNARLCPSYTRLTKGWINRITDTPEL